MNFWSDLVTTSSAPSISYVIILSLLPILIGFIITLVIIYFIVLYYIRQRSKNLYALEFSWSEARILGTAPIWVFILVFYGVRMWLFVLIDIIPVLSSYAGLLGLIGFLLWLFAMQYSLRQNLLNRWLDEEKAKKISWSVANYYFWTSLLLGVLYILWLSVFWMMVL